MELAVVAELNGSGERMTVRGAQCQLDVAACGWTRVGALRIEEDGCLEHEGNAFDEQSLLHQQRVAYQIAEAVN
jgi:hypothetical protein